MSEVTDAPTRQANECEPQSGEGGFIWYELMTSDAEAAGNFYSAVVKGWTFGDRVPTDVDYRMIQRSDGGNAGGVLALDRDDEGGRRPAGLARLSLRQGRRCDGQTRSKPTAGKLCASHGDSAGVGRLAMVTDPQGAPFYLMNPDAAGG